MKYSKEFKQSIIIKMLPPNHQSISQLIQETGTPEGTLKKWRSEMRKDGFTAPAGVKQSKKWSARDKFSIVIEIAALSEIKLAEYCRKKGLYVEQVKSWQDNCLHANGESFKSYLQENAVKKKRKKLKQVRKKAGLAETAAIIDARKKGRNDLGIPGR